ncbi:MAG: ATP-binding cassette domain-containing protein [Candidatus Rokubacteria bacterium]|nr:ATP-binding cassette domain-containing protein [Candidatus Rokubacteria bacterium]
MEIAFETVTLTKFFGMVRAAEDLNIRIAHGELVGIVGPNGSGKTTFLNLVTGYVKPDRGRVRYLGEDITGLSPRTVATLGIARSFQIPQLYSDLTVEENLLLALAFRSGRGGDFWGRLALGGFERLPEGDLKVQLLLGAFERVRPRLEDLQPPAEVEEGLLIGPPPQGIRRR